MTKQNMNQTDVIEHADFTDASKKMATLMASILLENEPNHIKIQIIKEEVSSGRYQINTGHIANKLLEYAPVFEEVMAC